MTCKEVALEYETLRKLFPQGYEVVVQSLCKDDTGYFDLIEIRLPDGKRECIMFRLKGLD